MNLAKRNVVSYWLTSNCVGVKAPLILERIMIYYEVVEDVGDGYAANRRFRTLEEAEAFVEMVNGSDGDCVCLNGVDTINTESSNFYYSEDK
jgi:hypothetical protein